MKAPFSTKSEIKAYLSSIGIRAQKKYGQNFLVDQNIVQFIVESGSKHLTHVDSEIAEIGIGLGSLTYPLLSLKRKTYLFEIDHAYIRLAKERILNNFSNVHLIEGDALENLHRIQTTPVFIFGNLPYHLTTEILIFIVSNFENWLGGIFMVQKEFADRLTSEVSSISVFLKGLTTTKHLKVVHKNCFYPIPKIHSSLIQILPLAPGERRIQTKNEILLWSRLLRAIFWGKRKQIQVSLRESPFSKDSDFQLAVQSALEKSGINPKSRPEELNQEQFLTLGQHLLDDLSK